MYSLPYWYDAWRTSEPETPRSLEEDEEDEEEEEDDD